MEPNIVKQIEREFDSTLINYLISQGFLRFSLIDKSQFGYRQERDELHKRDFYIASIELEGKRYSQLFVCSDDALLVRPISNIIIETAAAATDD